MTAVATPFPIQTTSAIWALVVAGLGDAARPREKKAPDGRGTFATGCVLLRAQADGTSRADKAVSVNVVDALPEGSVYELGVRYVADGAIWVTPYAPDGGRVTMSITVERLVLESEVVTGGRRRGAEE